jgi:thiol-disulfide isomerase/thioredoxin
VSRDVAAGFLAIVAVVATAVYTQFVGSDLRALFGISGSAFLLAGLSRAPRPEAPAWRQGLIISLPGLLGDVALIMNNGLGRLDIPIAISVTSIACAIGGAIARRAFPVARARALGIVAIVLAALAVWVLAGLPRYLVRMSFHWSDRPAPALRFVSLDGAPVMVPDPQHRVMVLAFWTTWCLPCRWEMPELAQVQRRLAADPRVVLWAIDVGWGPESPARARKFLARRGWAVPAAFDSAFSAQALGVHALPAFAIVDGAGRLRLTHAGYDRSEDLPVTLTAAIRRVLAEQGP